ncbi:centromere protein N isoform X2 [Ictidomys tridecemlineatus]|uniref:centromere protein N isoform X2 n=1 Tax=Ictidomys tridecemlineatus TaxID=43179 RepID=UPI0006811379|nr:centromere protein N isoform X2 [Ictidomys tridecemlineatus]KAG3256793.1 centromere protein N, transcript variant X4 [Ictidomys tridecemlineatus]
MKPAKEMDETVAEFIRRTILKIPMNEMMTILKAWDFLSENQLQTINFRQRKECLVQDLVGLCEEKCASINDAALLDIIYTQVHRHQKVWDVFQMSKEPDEDVDLFDMEQFKRSFKKILQRALKNALTVASKHHQIVKMDLRSRHLDSLKAIVFKQYDQTFENHNSTTPLQERCLGLDVNMDSRIIHENKVENERVQRITQESFGDYPQPQLEFAQYKLETKFKSDLNGGILAERKEPLRCLIKFSSPHLLEALKSLAPAGIADAPLSPLLTCIPNKGMNYFKIRDK